MQTGDMDPEDPQQTTTKGTMPFIVSAPSLPFSFHLPSTQPGSKPALAAIQKSYEMFCNVRKSAEMAVGIGGHVIVGPSGEFLVPTTYKTLNCHSRVMIHALFDFASQAFPEFHDISGEEKWLLIRNYIYRLIFFECAHRANKIFPGNYGLTLGGMSTYINMDDLEHLFVDAPPEVDRATIFEVGQTVVKPALTKCRTEIVDYEDEEFFALIGLLLWNLGPDASGSLLCMAESARSKIMRDLHVFYVERGREEELATGTCKIVQILTERIMTSVFMQILLKKNNPDFLGIDLVSRDS